MQHSQISCRNNLKLKRNLAKEKITCSTHVLFPLKKMLLSFGMVNFFH